MAEKPKRAVKKKSASAPPLVQDKVWGRIFLLAVWLLAGLYIGIAGWSKITREILKDKAVESIQGIDCNNPTDGVLREVDGIEISFCTDQEAILFEHEQQMGMMGIAWIMKLPDPLPFIFSAFSFGVVGSIVSLLRFLVNKQDFPNYYALSIAPIVGGITALMLLGITMLVPGIFTFTSKPEVHPFLSLFAGAFSEHVQKWFQSWMNTTFKIEKEKK